MARPHPHLAIWKRLWERDRRIALAFCDAIVKEDPVPERLLARLGVVTRMERMMQDGELRGSARPWADEDVRRGG